MDDILFFNLSPEEIVVLVAIFAIGVGRNLTEDELLVLGNFMVSAGVALLIIVTQRVLIRNQEQQSTHTDVQSKIQNLEKEVQQLKQLLHNQ